MKEQSYYTMTLMRDSRFCEAVRQQLKLAKQQGRALTERDAVNRALLTPADGYFVSVDHARHMISKLHNGHIRRTFPELKRRMWEEFDSKVMERCRQKGCSQFKAICHVLASATASRYFIAPSTAYKIYRESLTH